MEVTNAYGENHEPLFQVFSFWVKTIFSAFFGVVMFMQVFGLGLSVVKVWLSPATALDFVILTVIFFGLMNYGYIIMLDS